MGKLIYSKQNRGRAVGREVKGESSEAKQKLTSCTFEHMENKIKSPLLVLFPRMLWRMEALE